MTVALTTYQLRNMLRRIDPHIGREAGYAGIQGVRLDYDGRNLHAVATDRYTLAVARQETKGNLISWAVTVNASSALGDHLAAVTSWLNAQDAEATITLTANTEQVGATLTLANGSERRLTVPVYDGHFPDWRGLIRTAMQTPAGQQPPYTSLDTKLLARWQCAGRDLRTWQSTASKPIVVTGPDFIGVQMPTRYTGDSSELNIAHDAETWAATLGAGQSVEMDDTLSTWEPKELEERDNVIGQQAEGLLKLTLRSTGDLFNIATGDTGALTAYALMGTQSWMAYRLLKALQKADPDLLRTVLAETVEELEDGAISEWAWDEAVNAGHDPQQWHDDYEAHLKKLAAKKNAA